jgi:hypothetical protein
VSSTIIVQGGGPAAPSAADQTLAAARAYRVLRWAGLLLAGVTIVDVALVFVPMQWERTDWVLATLVQSIGGLPVLAVGLGALTASVVGLGEAGPARAVAAAHVLLVLAIVAVVLAFTPVAMAATRTAPDGLTSDVGRAVIRTFAYSAIFITLHAKLAAVCWRAGRPPVGAAA